MCYLICYSFVKVKTYNTLEKKLDDQKEDIQELTEQLEEVKKKAQTGDSKGCHCR